MRENLERVLDLALAITLISLALSSAFSIKLSIDRSINLKNFSSKSYVRDFSPKSNLDLSGEELKHIVKKQGKYLIAAEFKSLAEEEAEKQLVKINGKYISLSLETDSKGICDKKGRRLNSLELRDILLKDGKESLELKYDNNSVIAAYIK